MRATARELFLQALAETSIAKAFERNVSYSRGVLQVCDDLYDLGAYNRVFVLAIGAGWKEDEYRAYGYDFPPAAIRIQQLAETAQIVRLMFTEPVATFHGRRQGNSCVK